ncbi:hypothetical protein N7527_004904 [Penicillium freii]|nr:hypothetical protein N7527_004904 [Penicillium freii]
MSSASSSASEDAVTTTSQAFPTDYYINCVVRFLDTIQYNDTNYAPEERLAKLHYADTKTAKHFANYDRQKHIKVSPSNLQALVQVAVTMVVYSWATASEKVTVDLSIHYTYMLILGDGHDDDPTESMKSFYDTILAGLPQEHPWWQMVNNHLPQVLRHYGPYCGLNIIRSTTDSAIAQIKSWIAFVNDLLSFYTEFDGPRDQTSLVNNYDRRNEITLEESLKKLTKDTIVGSEQLLGVFRDKHPRILHTLRTFCQGYVTWHLCDPGYRLQEVHSLTKESPKVSTNFHRYLQSAKEVGSVDPKAWAYPSVASLAAEDLAYWPDGL